MSEGSSRFSLIDTIAIGFVVLLLAAAAVIVLPGLQQGRRPRRQMPTLTQLRGIHQSMVMYAQGNGNYYPGFDANGNLVNATVEYRYQVLLDGGNYFTGEYMISPSEVKTEWTTGPVTSGNFSFAMLDIDAPGERAQEWRETLNTEATVMTDRNTGTDAHAGVMSIHTNVPGDWRGSTAWNDNHTAFSTTHLVDTLYGAGQPNVLDNLFDDAGGSDAFMIHAGD